MSVLSLLPVHAMGGREDDAGIDERSSTLVHVFSRGRITLEHGHHPRELSVLRLAVLNVVHERVGSGRVVAAA